MLELLYLQAHVILYTDQATEILPHRGVCSCVVGRCHLAPVLCMVLGVTANCFLLVHQSVMTTSLRRHSRKYGEEEADSGLKTRVKQS